MNLSQLGYVIGAGIVDLHHLAKSWMQVVVIQILQQSPVTE